MHCWFHRNVTFSALICGAGIAGWENTLTKTWLYRGTLHGVVFEDLPLLLSLHSAEDSFAWLLGKEHAEQASIVEKILKGDLFMKNTGMRALVVAVVFALTLTACVQSSAFAPQIHPKITKSTGTKRY